MRKISKKKSTALTATVCIAFATTSFSPVHAEAPEEYSLDQVVVTANRVPGKISESAANVSVVTRKEIEQHNYSDIVEALKNVNGVTIMQQGGTGERYARLNGEERILVMIDGRRLNLAKSSGSYGGYATFDLTNLPLIDNVERIEVVKGPASALYGSDAVGGVINIITRKGKENRNIIKTAVGSWGNRSTSFVNEGNKSGIDWQLALGEKEQDYFRYKNLKTGNVEKMENSDFKQKSATFRLDKDLGDNDALTFNFEHLGGAKGQYNGAGIKHVDKSYLDTLQNNVAMTYTFNKDHSNEGYLRTYRNFFEYNTMSWSKYSNKYTQYLFTNKETGAEWQNKWKLNANNTLVGGADWRKTEIIYKSSMDDTGIINSSVYLEDNLELDDRWTLTPGIRNDHHSMFGNKATPRVSLNCKMDKTANAYVSWGEVFNAPDASRLFWRYASMGMGTYYIGNPNLKPETGSTVTIGVNKDFGKQGVVKLSAFSSKLNDAIVSAEHSTLPNTTTWMNVQTQDKKGMELEYSRALSDKFRLTAGYSYVEVDNKGFATDTLRTLEPNAYRLGLSYDCKSWNIELAGRAASGRSAKYFSESDYQVWDLAINYKIADNKKVFMKFNNITNEAYEIYGAGKTAEFGLLPMPSRNVVVGMEYSF